MSPEEQVNADNPPMDEGVVFSAAVRRYLAAMPVSSGDVAEYVGQIQTRIDAASLVTVESSQPRGHSQNDGDHSRSAERHAPTFRRDTLWGGTFKVQTLRGGILTRRPLWSVAAIGVLALVVSLVTWPHGVTYLTPRTAMASSAYTTANAQRATITLSDGSTVALDVASRLEVPTDYVAGHRTVRLVGAALFTVAHHTGTPFTVVSGAAVAQVLGTSFLVRHYATDSLTTVAVRDGRVAVRSTVLTAERQVLVGPQGIGEVQPADPAQFSFAAGVLTLNGVPLRQAIVELDRWYDADIRLGDPSLATRQMVGECAAGSVADLMDILAGALNVRVVRHGRVLTLYPR